MESEYGHLFLHDLHTTDMPPVSKVDLRENATENAAAIAAKPRDADDLEASRGRLTRTASHRKVFHETCCHGHLKKTEFEEVTHFTKPQQPEYSSGMCFVAVTPEGCEGWCSVPKDQFDGYAALQGLGCFAMSSETHIGNQRPRAATSKSSWPRSAKAAPSTEERVASVDLKHSDADDCAFSHVRADPVQDASKLLPTTLEPTDSPRQGLPRFDESESAVSEALSGADDWALSSNDPRPPSSEESDSIIDECDDIDEEPLQQVRHCNNLFNDTDEVPISLPRMAPQRRSRMTEFVDPAPRELSLGLRAMLRLDNPS